MATPLEFVGRSEELGFLRDAHASPKSEFYPVYGRRRVGKTELILRFVAETEGLYFLGKEGPEDLQVREFLRAAATSLGQPVLAAAAAGISDWRSALETVMSLRPEGRKLVIALDEFQWIASSAPAIMGTLQELWDREWKRSGEVFLILCGSYIGFMEREVMGERSPLFGRRTGQILLQPFPYKEAALFHPRLAPVDLAQTYFLCGGIPLYLEFFDPGRSIAQNIQANILAKNAPLAREPDFLLREELRGVENYHAVLMAIAGGAPTGTAIAKATGIPDRNVYYYLQNLCELRYVRRRYPLTGRRPAKRSVRFTIEDPLLQFWFRFVYPNGSQIARLGPRAAFDQLVAPELDAYFGLCFERLCREALADTIYPREKVGSAYEVGEFWSKDTQIDLVGRRKDDRIDIGECKWGTVRTFKGLEQEVSGRRSQATPIPRTTPSSPVSSSAGSRPAQRSPMG